MPYKNKEQQKEAQRKAMDRMRKAVNPVVNPVVNPAYPAIIQALCDPVKRYRLERINLELQKKGLGAMVTMGYPGPDFNIIDSYLKATS